MTLSNVAIIKSEQFLIRLIVIYFLCFHHLWKPPSLLSATDQLYYTDSQSQFSAWLADNACRFFVWSSLKSKSMEIFRESESSLIRVGGHRGVNKFPCISGWFRPFLQTEPKISISWAPVGAKNICNSFILPEYCRLIKRYTY